MRKALRARGRSGRSVARVLRWSPLSIVLVVLVVGSGAPAHLTATESGGAAATSATALPHLAIIFAANSTAEVRALIGDHRYIQPGDAFDLDSGSPSNVALSVSHIDQWARMLHAAYPGAMIYAHTSGIAHYTTLAKRAGPDVSGVYYDYEPEVTANFTPTLAEFTKITAIAHRYGLESIGYPTGQPILSTSYRSDDGQFPQRSAAVDQLVIPTQPYCHESTSPSATAVTTLPGQYAHRSQPFPALQITIGTNRVPTPNGVGVSQAYDCARVRTGDGLPSPYLRWGPGMNEKVVHFLKEIGRG